MADWISIEKTSLNKLSPPLPRMLMGPCSISSPSAMNPISQTTIFTPMNQLKSPPFLKTKVLLKVVLIILTAYQLWALMSAHF
jgi:hypothetical protein